MDNRNLIRLEGLEALFKEKRKDALEQGGSYEEVDTILQELIAMRGFIELPARSPQSPR